MSYEGATALVDYAPRVITASAVRQVIRYAGYGVGDEDGFQTILTRDGRRWVQAFIDHVDASRCTGCGRCVRVCGQGVYALAPGREGKKAVVVNGGNCLGDCHCHRVCRSGALVCRPVRLSLR